MTAPRSHETTTPPARLRTWWAVLGVVVVAVNLRPAVVAFGPVLGQVQSDTGLSDVGLSVITALPVACFGAGGLLAGRLIRRRGTPASIVLALLVLALGSLVRTLPGVPSLVAGTVVAASGIAVLNVALPVAVKSFFPTSFGRMTGVYSTVLGVAAAAAAALAVPISTSWGWRASLGVWALPAVLGALVWRSGVPQSGSGGGPRKAPQRAPLGTRGMRVLLHDAVAWQVTGFLGLQSLTYYSVLTWLPQIHRSQGISVDQAGVLLAILTALGIPAALVVPSITLRVRRPALIGAVLSGSTILGLTGLLVAPSAPPILWAALLGVGLGGNFPLALTFLSARTRDAHDAAALSSMAQGVGYLIAATGPLAVGALRGATGSWTPGLILLIAVGAGQLTLGSLAVRDRFVASTT